MANFEGRKWQGQNPAFFCLYIFIHLLYSEYYGFNSYFGKSLATLDTQGFEGKKLF